MRKLKVWFKDIISRITGVSVPFFGISWSPPDSERKVIRDIFIYLEDRRALYNPYAHEIMHEVAQSIIEIRRELTLAIQRLSDDSKAIPFLRNMRSACREYLDSTRAQWADHFIFQLSLGRLRALFGENIAFLAAIYGIDIDGELAAILPPQYVIDEPDIEDDLEGVGELDKPS